MLTRAGRRRTETSGEPIVTHGAAAGATATGPPAARAPAARATTARPPGSRSAWESTFVARGIITPGEEGVISTTGIPTTANFFSFGEGEGEDFFLSSTCIAEGDGVKTAGHFRTHCGPQFRIWSECFCFRNRFNSGALNKVGRDHFRLVLDFFDQLRIGSSNRAEGIKARVIDDPLFILGKLDQSVWSLIALETFLLHS